MNSLLVLKLLVQIVPTLMTLDGFHIEFLQVIPVFASEVAFKSGIERRGSCSGGRRPGFCSGTRIVDQSRRQPLDGRRSAGGWSQALVGVANGDG